jgi:hypothetical protein
MKQSEFNRGEIQNPKLRGLAPVFIYNDQDLIFDGFVKSHFFRFPVIPAKARHAVKL